MTFLYSNHTRKNCLDHPKSLIYTQIKLQLNHHGKARGFGDTYHRQHSTEGNAAFTLSETWSFSFQLPPEFPNWVISKLNPINCSSQKPHASKVYFSF